MESKKEAENSYPMETIPPEILMHIFDFLTPNDWKAVRCVCKTWSQILYDQKYCERLPLVLSFCKLEPTTEPFETLINASDERPFFYMEIEKLGCDLVNASGFKSLFQKIGKQVIDLTLRSQMEPNFLTFFPNLKQLHVKKMHYVDTYKAIPKNLETVTAEKLMSKLEDAFDSKRLKKQLKTAHADWIPLDNEALSEEVTKLFKNKPFKLGSLTASNNFVKEPIVQLTHVTKVSIHGPVDNYLFLKSLENLNEVTINYEMNRRRLLEQLNGDDDDDCVCCSFHENLEMPKVKGLFFRLCHSMCDICFDTILSSFPSIEKLTLIVRVSSKQFSDLIQKYPKLKTLRLFFEKIDKQMFCHSGKKCQKEKEQPNIENFKYLENLSIISKAEFYRSGEMDDDVTNFINDNILKNWPKLPRLKVLELGNIDRDLKQKQAALSIYGNRDYKSSFGVVASNCPNVTNFAVGSEDFSLMDIQKIAQGWPQLKTLRLELTDLASFIDYKLRIIGKNCKNLKVFELYSQKQLRADEDVFGQFQLYQMIPALRVIKMHDRNNHFDMGTTRLVTYRYKTLDEILEFGKERGLEREMFNKYSSDSEKSDSEDEWVDENESSEEDESSDDDGHRIHDQLMMFIGIHMMNQFNDDD